MRGDGPIRVLAPAKINLYLHVTGRRPDGYHTLDSLVVFTDIGDEVIVEDAPSFAFHARGPFAAGFDAHERAAGPESKNLAVRAAHALARAAGRAPAVRVELVKNLPLAAGIGGGSADAAAVVRGMMALWGIAAAQAPYLPGLLLALGADVPACFAGGALRMEGIGERLTPVAGPGALPVVLAWPARSCPTPQVFAGHAPVSYSAPAAFIDGAPLPFLAAQGNDLTAAACAIVPEIGEALQALSAQPGALLARMCGSGATCFGLFADAGAARDAAAALRVRHPGWWVAAGALRAGREN